LYSTLIISTIRTTKVKKMRWTRMAKLWRKFWREHNFYYRSAKFRTKTKYVWNEE